MCGIHAMTDEITLRGLDGANPLAFLAALGTLVVATRVAPSARLHWRHEAGGWCPIISGTGLGVDGLCTGLLDGLALDQDVPFGLDKRLPFAATAFRQALVSAVDEAGPADRRVCDLLAAFGTDVHVDDNGAFSDTAFRMVRSGDAAGQGLLAYAVAIRRNTSAHDLHQALFSPWRYQDEDFSLRWDPVEDQRHALRWYDPGRQSNKKFGLRTMRGANCLALEGLSLLSVQPTLRGVATTGFSRPERHREYFTWPIWDAAAGPDLVRSLLALGDLHVALLPREKLAARGITEVYRCERIEQNQYYKNFAPAVPA